MTQKPLENLKFSIVIPSYNEKEEVRIAIDSAVEQNYQNKEIIVVDDSSDNTPDIIREYANRGVRLLSGPHKGCCEARNLGIQDASGDVILILHADVAIPKDFLTRVAKHYENGADWVQVQSRVYNTEKVLARFVQLQYMEVSYPRDDVWGTEGMTFKKSAAEDVGGYTGDFSVKFCRDWTIGKKLAESGYKKVLDRSIIVTHKAPETFAEYWQVRKTRGRFAMALQYYMWSKSLPYLVFKILVKEVLTMLRIVLIFPVFWDTYRMARHSDRPVKDFFALVYPYVFQLLALRVGEWEGIGLITRTRKQFGHERVKLDLNK